MEFQSFRKIARYSRDIVISEKLDGTNAQVAFDGSGSLFVGSRNKWITPECDNYGFAAWATANKDELWKLGPGRHFGEWWGAGIQRRYGMKQKVFSLFHHPKAELPKCCWVAPELYRGPMSEDQINIAIDRLRHEGSVASPGFMDPEGIVIYHIASGTYFKKTINNDHEPKGVVSAGEYANAI